ncbi:MAG: LysR family transcriptional regulator [Rhodobacteraceae bacterium]|nr:LysR family transcriptional regulator [Paracoccaceae bacterium]
MQTSHLRSFLAIKDTGSFTAAAAAVHLSHSAVSIQMKQLEQQLGASLFIKGRRPAMLTPLGEEIAEKAREIMDRLDDLKALAGADDLGGRVTLGFVPTTLQTLLPVVLERLRCEFPDLKVAVRSGLSSELAKMVEDHNIDFAFLSAPVSDPAMIRLHEIGSEPLFLVMAQNAHATSPAKPADILRQTPYIAFSRSTWLGKQIASHLTQSGHIVEPEIELDSFDAIEHLVARGFGVSIVPQRLLAAPLQETLHCISLGPRAPERRVMLATPRHCQRQTLLHCLTQIAKPKTDA